MKKIKWHTHTHTQNINIAPKGTIFWLNALLTMPCSGCIAKHKNAVNIVLLESTKIFL